MLLLGRRHLLNIPMIHQRVVKISKGDKDRYTYEELMETCANIASDVVKQGDIIKLQGEVLEIQKVVFHQYK